MKSFDEKTLYFVSLYVTLNVLKPKKDRINTMFFLFLVKLGNNCIIGAAFKAQCS